MGFHQPIHDDTGRPSPDMRTWSSPFPVNWILRTWLHEKGNVETEFPGPAGTLLILISPDQLLTDRADCGTNLVSIETQYRQMLYLQEDYCIKPIWMLMERSDPSRTPPIPDPLIALLLHHCASSLLSTYEKLEPNYSSRLEQALEQARDPIDQWLALRLENNRLRTLLEQRSDQVQRSQRLLTDLLKGALMESPPTDG